VTPLHQEKSLGELLRQAGKITSRQIQVALAEQRKSHEPIGKVLVRLGFVEEKDILQVMQGLSTLTFTIGGELFGVETFRAREVMKYVPYQPSEGEGGWVGTLNLRSGELPLLSLRKVLGLPDFSNPSSTWFILMDVRTKLFVIWVDTVKEVTRFRVDQIESPPPYLFGKKSELFYCLGKIKDDLYSILNPEKLLEEGAVPPPLPRGNHADPV
jgi:chemotaxis signal transduction protein